MEAQNVLKDPFPTSELTTLDFGSLDGRRDSLLEDSFVFTNSVKQFLQDRHSIIVGEMGAGKSALFELLKNNSDRLPTFKNKLVIPIHEAISFQLLRKFVEEEFSGHDKKLIYKIIWKFQILDRVCEEVSNLPDFPSSSEEREIKHFLETIKSREIDESVLGKFMGLLKKAQVRLKTEITGAPISLEMGLNDSPSKNELNLDRVYKCVEKISQRRTSFNPLVIIDRIDTFVAGENYDTQRAFINALLEVDDDLHTSHPVIGRKIFLRSDLFARLDYESLGYDKVNDNTLRVEWSEAELVWFIANRIMSAFKEVNLLNEAEVMLSSDLSEYHLSGFKILRLLPFIPRWVKKKCFNFALINQERNQSLTDRLNKSIITKVFPHKVIHKDQTSEEVEIDLFRFINTHFRDGHGKVLPRHLLTFLKQVANTSSKYYRNNPDQDVHAEEINGSWEWQLFKKRCIYEAYCDSKKEYIRNISRVENKWNNYFSVFIGKRGNKKTIDFNWVKTIVALDDQEVTDFLAYLNHIGFLYVSDAHPDPKRRKYKIPIIYMPSL